MSKPRRPQLEWPWDGIKAVVTLVAVIAVSLVLMQADEPQASTGPSTSPLAVTPTSEPPFTSPISPTDTAEPTTPPLTPLQMTDTPVPPAMAELLITLPKMGAVYHTPLPAFMGTGPAGATVVLLDGEDLLGSAVAGENGSWRFISRTPLSEGIHTIQAVIMDEAGDRQMESPPIEVTIAP